MKTSKSKKGLMIAGLVVGGLVMFGFKKVEAAKEVFANVEVGVKKISKLVITWTSVKFNVVMTLTNLTNIDFGATLTSKIAIKQIRVYTLQNEYLGKADTNIYKIDLPANTTVELPEATFNIDLLKAANNLLTNMNSYAAQDFSNLKFKIDIEVFGNIITLEP